MTSAVLARGVPRSVEVITDPITRAAIEPFDYAWQGVTTTTPWALPDVPADYGIGVIVGSSGSGKSTLLDALGGPSPEPLWSGTRSIASHFNDPDDAVARLGAVGLSSVPTWTKPYKVLSNGEMFRADLARNLHDGARVDEFTSVVDRHVAHAASIGYARHIRRNDIRRVIIATCHRDVIPWLNPDWVIDTDAGTFATDTRGFVQPDPVVVEIRRVRRDAWDHFKGHHYLTSNLLSSARCYIATWDDIPVGFASSSPFPHGSIKNGWREHRTVVLPEFQGLGIGVRLSDHIAAMHRAEGLRYFSRTQHPRMGGYRMAHPELWRATSSNRKQAKPDQWNVPNDERDAENRRDTGMANYRFDFTRVAYSHEYIGPGKNPDPIAVARQIELLAARKG